MNNKNTDTKTTNESFPEKNEADVLLEIEQMIKTNMSGTDKRKVELKKLREMIDSVLQNDETYREHAEKAKEANKVKSATKQQILKDPQNADVVKKANELSAEIKEMNDALSDYLREYQRMSGNNEIEGDDGEVREIVYVAKLVKKPR